MSASPEIRILEPHRVDVKRYAEADIPTTRGPVRCIVFRETPGGGDPDREHVLLVVGDPDLDDVLVRVHSECLTSEVFGSLKCDCREQFDAAFDEMIEKGEGMMVYLRQEGRGIGLGNKIRAYALQNQGLDTIDANHELGFETDLRTYDVAAEMLRDLGVRGVSLMTNNPDKLTGLQASGMQVHRRVPVEIAPNLHSRPYLDAKQKRLGHLLDLLAS